MITMSYITLSKKEIRELIQIRMPDLFKYLVTLMVLSFVCYELTRLMFPGIVYTGQLFVMLIFIAFYIGYLFYINKRFLMEIIYKRKIVYKGMLSAKIVSRNPSEGKYYFNMDGNIFSVGKEIFREFKEGDVLEFHISPSTKHLFKVASC
jgi:hypothetical protein